LGQSAPPCGEQEEEIVARTYLNLEKSHLEVLLRVLDEVATERILNPSEQYIQMILQEALDNIDIGM